MASGVPATGWSVGAYLIGGCQVDPKKTRDGSRVNFSVTGKIYRPLGGEKFDAALSRCDPIRDQASFLLRSEEQCITTFSAPPSAVASQCRDAKDTILREPRKTEPKSGNGTPEPRHRRSLDLSPWFPVANPNQGPVGAARTLQARYLASRLSIVSLRLALQGISLHCTAGGSATY